MHINEDGESFIKTKNKFSPNVSPVNISTRKEKESKKSLATSIWLIIARYVRGNSQSSLIVRPTGQSWGPSQFSVLTTVRRRPKPNSAKVIQIQIYK